VYASKKMKIGFIFLFTGCLSLINSVHFSDNGTSKMFILTTIQSSPSLLPRYLKRRSSVHLTYTKLNITDDSSKNNMSSSTNRFTNFDDSHEYNVIKDGSSKY